MLRPATGESFRFPFRRWLGASDAGGAVFPREQEMDVVAGGGPSEPAAPPANTPLLRPLSLRTGAAAVPHPDKMKAGARALAKSDAGHAGEDAYFVVRMSANILRASRSH